MPLLERVAAALLISVSGCTGTPQAKGSRSEARDPATLAGAPEPSAEAGDSVPPSDLGPSTVWRFTTRVESGPDSLAVNAHYELTVSGDATTSPALATLVKTGEDGEPFPEDRRLTARVQLAAEPFVADPEAPSWSVMEGWKHAVIETTLTRGSVDQPTSFELWIRGREMVGIWVLTGRHLEPVQLDSMPDATLETVWGGLAGTLDGPPLQPLPDLETLPCPVACDAELRCGGMGPEVCNGSMMCHEACGAV